MSPDRASRFLRVTAFLTLVTFTFQQVSDAQTLQNDLSGAPASYEQSVREPLESKLPSRDMLVPDAGQALTAIDFLQDEKPLWKQENAKSQSAYSNIGDRSAETREESVLEDFPERSAFEDAFEELRPEYASAVILESLSEENIRQLLDLQFEVGVVILAGEIVLLTSGNESEILTNKPAARILEAAAFTAHTHPKDEHIQGPSPLDLNKASGREYVLTDQSVYAYDPFDLEELSIPQFLEEFQGVLAREKDRYKENSVMARQQLNRFIREMDLLNESQQGRDSFRASGEVPTFQDDFSSATTLTQNWTVVKGSFVNSAQTMKHVLTTWSPNNNLLLPEAANPYAGINVLKNHSAAANVEAQAAFTFTHLQEQDVRGVIVRYQDAQNYYVGAYRRNGKYELIRVQNGVWTVIGQAAAPVVASWNEWLTLKVRVEGNRLSLYANGILKLEATDSAFANGKTGIYSNYQGGTDDFKYWVLGGVAQPPVVQVPAVTALPSYTKNLSLSLSGSKTAGTSIWIDGVERVPANASTSWSYNQTLTAGDGLKTFSVLAKDAAGTSSSTVSVSTTLDQTLPAGSVSLHGGAAYTTQTAVPATLTASDALSGLDQVRYQINGTWSAWESFSASKAINLSAGDGTKTVLYEIRDKAGNVRQASDTIVLDATAPSLSLIVNGGNTHTNTLSVNAALTASDTGSGLHQMRYQIAGGAMSAWETYASSKQITLPPGDGTKEVRFEVRDNAGNVRAAVSSVMLDTVPPVIAIQSPAIVSDPFVVQENQITIQYTSDGQVKTKQFTSLLLGDNALSLQETDLAGNVKTRNFTIKFVPGVVVGIPTSASLPAFTNQNTLTLSGTKQANTSIWINGAERVPVNASTAWSYNHALPAGDGVKSFSLIAKDAAGNASSVLNVSTVLDQTLPSGSVSLQAGAAYALSAAVTATLTASDVLAGLDQARYQVNGIWSAWESFTAAKALTLPEGDGTKTVLYEIRDKAGNVRQASDTIVLDATAPSFSLIVNGGNTHTNTLSVNAALTASDAGSGLHQMRYQIAGGAMSAWETYASSKQITLPAGDGAKDVRFEVRDNAGNVKSAVSSVTVDTVAPSLTTDSVYFQVQTAETGLGGYWGFDEASGTVFFDETDNANNGTLVNGTALVADHPAQIDDNAGSLKFDGINDYAEIPYTSDLNITGELTVSVWIKLSSTGRDQKIVGNQTGSSGGYKLGLFTDNRLELEVRDSNNVPYNIRGTAGGAVLQAGQWYHVVGVYSDSGNYIRTYVNGVLDRQMSTAGVLGASTGGVKFGKEMFANAWFLAGQLDEPKIYNRQLSLQEIQTLAQGGVLGSAVPPSAIQTDSLTVSYKLDGLSKSKIFSGLLQGENQLRISETDVAGNNTTLIGKVTVNLPNQSVLSDGTQLFRSAGILQKEITPWGDQIFYRADGSVEKYRYADGREIHFGLGSGNPILFYNAQGVFQETLNPPAEPQARDASWVRVGLAGGLSAFYEGQALMEILTETGIRITNVSFDASGSMKDAILFYPDGTIDILRGSKRIRHIGADHSILDYLPSGGAVREIFSDHTDFYYFSKASQAEILRTFVKSSAGSVTVYDDKGLLSEVRHGESALYYDRQPDGEAFRLFLNKGLSSAPDPKTMIEGSFNSGGTPLWIALKDGTRIYYQDGRLDRVVDSLGAAIDYDFEMSGGFVKELTVSRNGASFQYAADGFLQKIETSSGTVTRKAEDTDHDGKLTDEQIIEILLDETGGNRLTDFELDPDGKILNGIIITKEGIKQRIENSILTGYETVDGKWYTVTRESDGTSRANLSEWRFHDGTKAVYGGGSIAEILFPDGRKLHSLGMGSGQILKSYAETLPDGTEKHFLDGRLIKIVTAEETVLEYGVDGRANKLVLKEGESYDIEYLRDERGEVREIAFKGNASSRIFSSGGALTSVLAQGVRAEFAAGEVERIFTRYGLVVHPEFNESGLLSGDIRFSDGIVQSIEDGEVKMLTLDGGKKAFYQYGRLIRLESAEGKYDLTYADGTGSLQGVSLAFTGEVSWAQSLIPYLLDHPDSDLARLILSKPLHNALHERDEVQSDFETGDTLYFARLSPDSERGDVYGLGVDYLPYWTGLDLTTGYENSGSVQANRTMHSWLDAPSQISMLADMNGDGLADRIMLASVGENYWWVQLNSGQGLSSAVKWTGVDSSFNGGALHYQDLLPRVFGTLIDINGDGLPDRVLQNFDGSPEWQVQFNNGAGFNPTVLWGGAAHALQLPPAESRFASEVWDDQGNQVAALIDLDGDGLPDRVLRPYVAPFDRWFWQKNLGDGFADAMLWEGVSLSFNQDPKKAASIAGYAEIQNSYETPAAAAIRQKIAEWDQSIAYFNSGCNHLIRNELSSCRASAASAMFAAAQRIQDTIHAYGASFYAAYMDDPGVEFYSLQDYDRYKSAALYAIRFFQTGFSDTNAILDLNGDQLPDRILLKPKTGQAGTGMQEWWWQKNTGEGFELPALWDADVRALPGAPTAQAATSIRYVPGWLLYRDTLIDLIDVSGDGLPDRVTMDSQSSAAQTHTSWWVEVNTGSGFAPAVEWPGIYGTGSGQTSIQNNMTRFRHIDWGAYGPEIRQSASLKDISGDGIPDRVVFEPGSTHWKVQLGTGTGFLPVEEILIEALSAPAEVNTSRYDYLHVSLKSETPLSASLGQIKVTLGDPSEPESYQEWTVQDAGPAWKDYFLPLNPAKGNADQVRVEYIPASSQPSIPVYVDNLTFTGIRPPAGKDWLDRLLAEENVLSEIHSDRNQTLAQYLGYADSGQESSSLSAGLLQTLLNAETRLDFGTQGQLEEFETSYGSISKVENGRVIETVTTDGSRITFDEPDAESSPGSATRTIEDSSGNELVQQLSYGRVRQVIREGRQPLQYSYEFDGLGREITVVHDPETDVTERYRDIAGQSRILSRREANGVVTVFKHDSSGERTSVEVMYKGRVYETYHYGKTDEGLVTVAGDAGVVEEYDAEGVIRYHTTADGYRYAHSFENAHSIEVAYQTETETLPDQTVINVQIPVVTLKECESGCENVHRVSLTGYTSEDGTEGSYQDGDLKSLKYADGTRIFFTRSDVYEHRDAETGEILSELLLMDAVVVHPDGASTEYRGGKPYAVQRPNGQSLSLETEQGHLINPNESALFHYGQALKLWSDYLKPQWSEYIAPGSLALEINYDTEGQVVTRRYAEGVTEIYDDGRISMTVGSDGERLTHYQYDEDGNIVQVTLEASRRRLASSVLRVKAEIAMERQKALSRLADREQVLNQTIEGEYVVQRDRLLAIRARIEAQADKIASLKVKGKAAKAAIGDASSQIQAGLDQVNRALEKLAQNRIDALEQLSAQVNQTSGEIEENAQDSYEEISEQESLMQAAILRHEISPVIYHWYRKILGRDPAKGDYDLWISRANYTVGTFDLPFLKNELLQGDELSYRTAEVNFIKNTVTQNVQQYLTLSSEDKVLFADALGIPADKLVSLSHAEAERLLSWLNSRSLHFGQSAYVALESMLAKSGIAYERRELARRLILIDILTGTLTPMENGDLLISMFALKTVAALYGLSGDGYAINYQSLKALYDSACPSGEQTCQFRAIAHIDGNHYIVVTKVTEEEVTFIETGSATRLHQDLNTMSSEEFIASWTDASNPANRFGYIFSAQPPPAAEFSAQRASLMDDSKLMRVRGAFFIAFIVFAVLAVAKAVIAAVAATIAAISAIISGIAAGIGSILSGFGSLFSGLFTGQFLTGLQGLFHGLVTGIGQIAGAVFQGVVAFGHTFAEVYGVSGMILKGVELSATSFLKSFAATSFVKGTLTGSGIGLGFQGAGKLLEVMGVAPQISQTLMAGGKIITGAVMLGSGNAAGLGLLTGGSSEFLSLHTDLSPAMSGIIGIGAAALGAFAGGVGSLSGLEALKSVVPHLSMDLASSGLMALGDALKLDPRITSLASIPIRAGLGNGLGNFLKIDGYVDVIQNIQRDIAGNILKYSKEIVLDTIGLPPLAKDLVSGFISGFAASYARQQEGADSVLGASVSESVFGKINESFNRFAYKIAEPLTGALSFGAKALAGAGAVTVQGIKNAVNAFSNVFSRKAQEGIRSDSLGIRNAEVTVNGNHWVWQQGDILIDYDAQRGDLREFSGDDVLLYMSNGLIDNTGSLFYEKLDFKTAISESPQGAFRTVYENGRMKEWRYSLTDGFGITVYDSIGEGWGETDEWLERGDVEIVQGSIEIPGPDEPFVFDGKPVHKMKFTFKTEKGAVSKEWQVESAAISKTSSEGPFDPTKELFVLTNGVANFDDFASEYLRNLQRDIVGASQFQSGTAPGSAVDAFSDIIVAPTFGGTDTFANILKAYYGIDGAAKAALLMNDLMSYVAEQKAGLQTLGQQVKTSMEAFFKSLGDEHRVRPLVAVGYSGGFVPVMEAIMNGNAEYKVNAFVALGGATVSIGAEGAKKIVDAIATFEDLKTARSPETRRAYELAFGAFKIFFGLGVNPVAEKFADAAESFMGILDQLYNLIGIGGLSTASDIFYAQMRSFVQELTTFSWGGDATAAAKMLVNIYGTEDLLNRMPVPGVNIAGHRDELAGFSANSIAKPLFNIEIEGADHFDYILGVDKSKTGNEFTKNEIVSRFVAELILKVDSPEILAGYLSELVQLGKAQLLGTRHWKIFP